VTTPGPRLRTEAGRAVVEVVGPIDISNVDAVEALLREACDASGGADLDLTSVPFVAAAGLTMLIRFTGDIRLLRPSALTLKVLAITGLAEAFVVVP
jgi:anti-anti-sigma factor